MTAQSSASPSFAAKNLKVTFQSAEAKINDAGGNKTLLILAMNGPEIMVTLCMQDGLHAVAQQT